MKLLEANARHIKWLNQLKKAGLFRNEKLLPEIQVHCSKRLPSLMTSKEKGDKDFLLRKIKELSPWGYAIQLMQGVVTENSQVALDRMIYRSHLISSTVSELLGDDLADSSVLDLACNHGYFSLEICHLGARKAVGVDLRDENIAKANFLKNHFEIKNASFYQKDIYDLSLDEKFDIVYNLGLFYHITDPYKLMKQTYDLCNNFAVIDSIMHKDPVSSFILRVNKDTGCHAEGRFSAELHPTYRAMIDLMHAVGFKGVKEITRVPSKNEVDVSHDLYDRFDRRCLIGFK